jgi:hypothetical protein
LSAELKAVEAELAALAPRDDRLDRERLIFLAGRASVAARAPRLGALAWPGAFAGMTAVAAALLVMLLARPGVPTGAGGVVAEAPDAGPSDRSQVVDDGSKGPGVRAAPDSEDGASGPVLASYGADRVRRTGSPYYRTRAVDLEMWERMLTQGVDLWGRPRIASETGGSQEAGPRPYHQWLKTFLEDDARAELPSDWLDIPLTRGASS